jgi:hypothetical protein
MTSAAEAGFENKPFIAAINRCATQRQKANPTFSATSEAVPFQNNLKLTHSPQRGLLD